ncbi:hypothetical protein PWG14_08935 (plasmid) [Chromobacterium amazonense]|uniref:hypothetical protein n=1 Tax=Chromobacterium amazonense TaxID=1382803 RepID=UPI00237DF28D|nr:hypothetical protein [Chromobacterium amazonense]MDE1712794.1 hypothetical protein [Chromobacterium amazonense]
MPSTTSSTLALQQLAVGGQLQQQGQRFAFQLQRRGQAVSQFGRRQRQQLGLVFGQQGFVVLRLDDGRRGQAGEVDGHCQPRTGME